jgi:hypothetical protein
MGFIGLELMKAKFLVLVAVFAVNVLSNFRCHRLYANLHDRVVKQWKWQLFKCAYAKKGVSTEYGIPFVQRSMLKNCWAPQGTKQKEVIVKELMGLNKHLADIPRTQNLFRRYTLSCVP